MLDPISRSRRRRYRVMLTVNAAVMQHDAANIGIPRAARSQTAGTPPEERPADRAVASNDPAIRDLVPLARLSARRTLWTGKPRGDVPENDTRTSHSAIVPASGVGTAGRSPTEIRTAHPKRGPRLHPHQQGRP